MPSYITLSSRYAMRERSGTDGRVRIDEARTVRIGERHRMDLVDVAEAGRARGAGERVGEVRGIVRPHVVHRALVGGRLQAGEKRIGPPHQVSAGLEGQRRDPGRIPG